MSSSNTVLFVVTSHSTLGDTNHPTGFYYDELATPYWAVVDAGFDVQIASIKGGKPPHDPGSLKPAGERPAAVERFVADPASLQKITNTPSVDTLSAQDYAGIFLPGGHGTAWDFPTSQGLAQIVSDLFNENKAVGAVCHGPTGLVNAKRHDGKSILFERNVNAFTDAEERAVGLENTVPFLLESRMRELGGIFEASDTFEPHAVRDDNLVTGQNPASAEPVARLFLEALREA